MRQSLQQPRGTLEHPEDLISKLSAPYSEAAATVSTAIHRSEVSHSDNLSMPPPPLHHLILPPAAAPQGSPISPRHPPLSSCLLNRQRAAAETMKLHSHPPNDLNQTWLLVSPYPPSVSPNPQTHPNHLSFHLPTSYPQLRSSGGRPYSEDISTLKSESRSSVSHSALSHHSSDHLITGADIATGTGELLLLDKEGRVVHQVSSSNNYKESRNLLQSSRSPELIVSSLKLEDGTIAPPPTARDMRHSNEEEEEGGKGREGKRMADIHTKRLNAHLSIKRRSCSTQALQPQAK